jgi:hypothetical protein
MARIVITMASEEGEEGTGGNRGVERGWRE